MCLECCIALVYSVSKKVAPKNYLQYFHSFMHICIKFCQFISTHMHQFWSVYLLVNKMALIFLGVPIVFLCLRFPFSVSRIALTSSLMMSSPNVYDYVMSLNLYYDNVYLSTLMMFVV